MIVDEKVAKTARRVVAAHIGIEEGATVLQSWHPRLSRTDAVVLLSGTSAWPGDEPLEVTPEGAAAFARLRAHEVKMAAKYGPIGGRK